MVGVDWNIKNGDDDTTAMLAVQKVFNNCQTNHEFNNSSHYLCPDFCLFGPNRFVILWDILVTSSMVPILYTYTLHIDTI